MRTEPDRLSERRHEGQQFLKIDFISLPSTFSERCIPYVLFILSFISDHVFELAFHNSEIFLEILFELVNVFSGVLNVAKRDESFVTGLK